MPDQLLNETNFLELATQFIIYFTYIYRFTLFLAPLLATIFIIIGGMKVTISGGRPDRLHNAKLTITYALIGCLVVLFSYPILTIIAGFFAPNALSPITGFMNIYANIVTITALIYIAWGGIEFITSSGNANKILEAKRTITYAIVGYVYMLALRIFLG